MNSLTDASAAGGAAQETATAPPKPKRITKKTREQLDAEFRRGFIAGRDAPRDRWPGAIAALLLAAASFALGGWLL